MVESLVLAAAPRHYNALIQQGTFESLKKTLISALALVDISVYMGARPRVLLPWPKAQQGPGPETLGEAYLEAKKSSIHLKDPTLLLPVG